MPKYELTFMVQPLKQGAPLGMLETQPPAEFFAGSGSTQTVMYGEAFSLGEYSKTSGIPVGEFCTESVERVMHACQRRTEPAVVNVNHRPISP